MHWLRLLLGKSPRVVLLRFLALERFMPESDLKEWFAILLLAKH